jgi:EAL domain-containing protein (putative c-di-GMP-specific phosphodiesterase class I)
MKPPEIQCGRCEALPEALPEKGKLYLVPPIAVTAEAVKTCAETSGLIWAEIYPNLYEITFNANGLKKLCTECLARFGHMEMSDARSLVVPENEKIDIRLLMKMQPFSALAAQVKGGGLLDILRSERLEAWFQPIVNTSEPSKIFAHECLIRGRDNTGALVFPDQLFAIARSADLKFHLDRLCRITAIRDARKYDLASYIFINFNPSAIYDPEYCLSTTMTAVKEAGIPHDRIVFEVVESDDVKDTNHLLNILTYYRRRGFKVALDDLGAGYSSLNLLSILKPDFIKMDIQLIRNVDKDPYKGIVSAGLINLSHKLGARVIAEGVERKEEWEWVRGHGADFVQGYYFAKPAAPPLSVREII